MLKKTARSTLMLLLAVASAPASATVTLCFFSPYGPGGHRLEFTGHDELQTIESHDQAPRTLDWKAYKVLEFDWKARKVHLVYRNPGNPRLLPSFTLKGTGRNTWMRIGERRVKGDFHCGT